MKLLKEKSFCLTREAVRRNIAIPFSVERPFSGLVIQMRYAPHQVNDPQRCAEEIRACIRRYFPEEKLPVRIDPQDFEPLYNFITLSLDCGEEYVGCAHRHEPSLTVKISERESTPGFEPFPVREGRWRAVLHVHAVISDEVQCSVRIWGAEEADGEHSVSTL